MSVKVVIETTGRESAHDLAELRDWLESAGDRAPWKLDPEPPPSGEHLGIGVDEICAVITAVAELPALADRIKSWFPTRHAPEPIRVTITISPDPPEQGHDEPQA
jgi:Effector Associated Constant Component 1